MLCNARKEAEESSHTLLEVPSPFRASQRQRQSLGDWYRASGENDCHSEDDSPCQDDVQVIDMDLPDQSPPEAVFEEEEVPTIDLRSAMSRKRSFVGVALLVLMARRWVVRARARLAAVRPFRTALQVYDTVDLSEKRREAAEQLAKEADQAAEKRWVAWQRVPKVCRVMETEKRILDLAHQAEATQEALDLQEEVRTLAYARAINESQDTEAEEKILALACAQREVRAAAQRQAQAVQERLAELTLLASNEARRSMLRAQEVAQQGSRCSTHSSSTRDCHVLVRRRLEEALEMVSQTREEWEKDFNECSRRYRARLLEAELLQKALGKVQAAEDASSSTVPLAMVLQDEIIQRPEPVLGTLHTREPESTLSANYVGHSAAQKGLAGTGAQAVENSTLLRVQHSENAGSDEEEQDISTLSGRVRSVLSELKEAFFPWQTTS
eukprot:TRINITY_DN52897_c0_g1_i1.p1 TRINITY_DN52897_c0_g1~~TRINITY_DN52897_c0_g1_i1.p1  ORF type:complete len:489 (-),score=103.38 TRINITY_DN52897_c0_g1_i1:221-1543(-)